jgi:hypothetical protein
LVGSCSVMVDVSAGRRVTTTRAVIPERSNQRRCPPLS